MNKKLKKVLIILLTIIIIIFLIIMLRKKINKIRKYEDDKIDEPNINEEIYIDIEENNLNDL